MKYSPDVLREMSQKVDLLDYASRSVDFVRHSGDTHYAVCPFHHEKTASLAVRTDKNLFHCFGCGKSGNIYNWIQLTEGLTFDQAVQKVADITNSDLQDYVEPESLSFYRQLNRLDNKSEKNIDRTVLDFNKDYIQRFKDEVPTEWIEEGIQEEEIKKYEIRIDPISNRIVYPVYDSNFQFIGVKGRTRYKNFKELGLTKYMNYNKIGTIDYFQGMKQAQISDEIIIVEGLKSVMKLDAWGYHDVVSAETSCLNEYQMELLLKMQLKDIIIAFDKDVDINKVSKSTRLLKRFANVYVVYDKHHLLDDKDSPCDKGIEVWRRLLAEKIKL